jgi:hypothetical protein
LQLRAQLLETVQQFQDNFDTGKVVPAHLAQRPDTLQHLDCVSVETITGALVIHRRRDKPVFATDQNFVSREISQTRGQINGVNGIGRRLETFERPDPRFRLS